MRGAVSSTTGPASPSPLVAAASAVQIAIILAVILVAGRLFGFSSPGRVE